MFRNIRFFKKDKSRKISLTLKDLEYLYQYIVLNVDQVKFYKNLALLIDKKREEIYSFFKLIDHKYLNKTNLTYVTGDTFHNFGIFDRESLLILYTDITDEFIDFLKSFINVKRTLYNIDKEFKGVFKTKGLIFLVFVLILYLIIYILGKQFLAINIKGVHIDLSSVRLFYEYDFIISSIYFIIFFIFYIYKYISFKPLYVYMFSKYYVLVYYKLLLYAILVRYYIEKKGGRAEIGYFNVKKEYYDIISNLSNYLNRKELAELLFFIENPEVEITLHNPILKQELINDYRNLLKYQLVDVKKKIFFFKELKKKVIDYYSLLQKSFYVEIDNVRSTLNFQGLIMYITIILLIVIMLMPVLLSSMR